MYALYEYVVARILQRLFSRHDALDCPPLSFHEAVPCCSSPIAVSGSGDTGKQIESFDAVNHIQGSPSHKRFLVGCSSPFMRLAERPTALRAGCKQCLGWSDKKPTCSVPALWGCEGLWSTVVRLGPCMIMSTPRSLSRLLCRQRTCLHAMNEGGNVEGVSRETRRNVEHP